MGFTHYFRIPEELEKDKFEKLRTLAKRMQLAMGVKATIGGGFHDEEANPEFTKKRIWFNGVKDLGHETMYIPQKLPKGDKPYFSKNEETGLVFHFCKTARKPYDELVVGVLVALKELYGDSVKLGSDGNAPEWKAGIKLYEKASGKSLPKNWFKKNMD